MVQSCTLFNVALHSLSQVDSHKAFIGRVCLPSNQSSPLQPVHNPGYSAVRQSQSRAEIFQAQTIVAREHLQQCNLRCREAAFVDKCFHRPF